MRQTWERQGALSETVDIWSCGCQAHLLNLAATDIQEKYQGIVSKIVDVLKDKVGLFASETVLGPTLLKAFRNIHVLGGGLVT